MIKSWRWTCQLVTSFWKSRFHFLRTKWLGRSAYQKPGAFNELINELISSIKRKRGAGFPTGLKWKPYLWIKNQMRSMSSATPMKGRTRTFKDREILSRVPLKVLMGSYGNLWPRNRRKKGYIPREYFSCNRNWKSNPVNLNFSVKEIKYDFKISIFMGSGAYICGESSPVWIHGRKRGEPRNKPPYPTAYGYMGKPTVCPKQRWNAVPYLHNNIQLRIQTLLRPGCSVLPRNKTFLCFVTHQNRVFYELELGMSLTDFVEEFGDDDTKAVQVGGAAGFPVPIVKIRRDKHRLWRQTGRISLPQEAPWCCSTVPVPCLTYWTITWISLPRNLAVNARLVVLVANNYSKALKL